MASRLENGTYLLDAAESDAYVFAARMIERVDGRRLDLTQPLVDFDYLLVMCAHMIIEGDDRANDTLGQMVSECLEARRRNTC